MAAQLAPRLSAQAPASPIAPIPWLLASMSSSGARHYHRDLTCARFVAPSHHTHPKRREPDDPARRHDQSAQGSRALAGVVAARHPHARAGRAERAGRAGRGRRQLRGQRAHQGGLLRARARPALRGRGQRSRGGRAERRAGRLLRALRGRRGQPRRARPRQQREAPARARGARDGGARRALRVRAVPGRRARRGLVRDARQLRRRDRAGAARRREASATIRCSICRSSVAPVRSSRRSRRTRARTAVWRHARWPHTSRRTRCQHRSNAPVRHGHAYGEPCCDHSRAVAWALRSSSGKPSIHR